MTRRADSQDPDRQRPKKPVADQYPDSFRAGANTPRPTGQTRRNPQNPRRKIAVFLLSLWLVAWTLGLLLVIVRLIDTGFGDPILWLWCLFALGGWIMALVLLQIILRRTPA